MSKGLTLIESLISIAIVVFGVSFIALVFPLTLHKTHSNEKDNLGFFVASAKMERLIASNYDELEEGVFSDNYENYEVEIEISCFHPERECLNEDTGIKKIKVGVSSALSTESIINLSTLVIKE